MFLRSSVLAVALSSLIVIAPCSILAQGEDRASCNSYTIEKPSGRNPRNALWTNGGGTDSEWINKSNWRLANLPGFTKFQTVILAAGDTVTVHCPVTYMEKGVSLDMKAGATLDIQQNLPITGKIMLRTKAEVTQSKQSEVKIEQQLHLLAASYSILDEAKLVIGTELFINPSGKLTINGDKSSISVSSSRVNGVLNFKLGPEGTGTFHVDGLLTIMKLASLSIDTALYDSSKAAKIQLIKFNSSTGSFKPNQIEITGLAGGMVHKIIDEEDGLYLDITQGEAPPVKEPTLSPIETPPVKEPTLSPIETPPVKEPTLSPIETPPVKEPTLSPIQTPIEGVTKITLSASGFAAISNTRTCPPQETSTIVIDGTSYTAGPNTITLYRSCTVVNDEFDLINIKLENFPEGLWFEIAYKRNRIDLVIKSLRDYSGYWSQVKLTYKAKDNYEETSNTDHFPQFSWETIPTWIRYRTNINKRILSDDELKSIAENHHLSWYGLGTPAHVRKVTSTIKGYNQDHTMLLYWNSQSYWGSDIPTFKKEYLLANQVGTGERGLYDHSNPRMRRWWINYAKGMVKNENIDGEFTDNTLSPECNNGACDLARTVKSKMIANLAAELPKNSLKLGNFVRQYFDGGNRFRLAYADGTYFENQHKDKNNQPKHEGIIVSMQLAREASWKKKVVLWAGSRRNCGCGFNFYKMKDIPVTCKRFSKLSAEPTDLLMEDLNQSLGEFLMIVEKFSYINFNVSPDANCESWRWNTNHLPQFSKSLGKPKGPPLKMGHTFSRHFEHVSVKVNVATEETTFIWLE